MDNQKRDKRNLRLVESIVNVYSTNAFAKTSYDEMTHFIVALHIGSDDPDLELRHESLSDYGFDQMIEVNLCQRRETGGSLAGI